MSQPRHIVPGATYLITRRCYQRLFRLRPSPETTSIVAYCLALALYKTGVVLHAACFMSNHHHLVVTDPHGVLPIFLRELHRSIAKALNAAQGQWENLWSAEPCSVVRLVDDEDVIDKISYVVANPVAAGLVRQPEDWPGLILWRDCVMRVTRVKAYFDKRGRAPEVLDLRVVSYLSEPGRATTWARQVQCAVAEKVAAAHRAMRDAGRTFIGRAAVLAESFAKRASSFEPKRAMVPSVAAKESAARVAMLEALRAFRNAYRIALSVWQEGVRDVVFPFGTWWMRVHHRAPCATV